MQARTPGFVTLNDRKVKVQQWTLQNDRALLTALVHGDAAGNELMEHLRGNETTLAWDDTAPVAVRPEITHHRVAGTGPTAVHRIEVTLWFMDAPTATSTPSTGDKLDQILHEVQMLRKDVAELRVQRGLPDPATPVPGAGQTLLDFDIDTDESN